MRNISFSFHSDSVRRVLFPSLFYKWRTWGSERLSNSPKSTQRMSASTRMRSRSTGLDSQLSMEHLKIILPPRRAMYLPLWVSLETLCFPGPAAISLIWVLSQVTKHEPKPSKTPGEMWAKEHEGDGGRPVCGIRFHPAITQRWSWRPN